MPFNLIKKYNAFLELGHYNEHQRIVSLKSVFDRDIANNAKFLFRTKVIRPLKKEGVADVESLFKHLTHQSETFVEEDGKKIKKRSSFDIERSKRLHWILNHIEERSADIDVFSFKDRKDGKDVVRTYIYDFTEKYIIILEPQRSKLDYYLLSAYYCTDNLGGAKQIEKKRKNKLPEVY